MPARRQLCGNQRVTFVKARRRRRVNSVKRADATTGTHSRRGDDHGNTTQVDTLAKENVRYLRVTRPSGGASHVYATPPDEIRVVPLVNEVEGAVERVRAFRDGQIR